jgi:exodeoxyribonuclease-3
MKVITINLNGIRSAHRKGFFEWAALQDADFICMQELKAQEKDMTTEMMGFSGYSGFFSFAKKPGYSGVGIYTKYQPKKIINFIDFDYFDSEGRYIELIFDNLSIISSYFPSGSSGDLRQEIKIKSLAFLKKLLTKKLKSNKNIILCGDLNIAHKTIDLKNDKGNKKNSGFLPEERLWLDELFYNIGWIDAYRKIYPNEEDLAYTWWSNRGQAWANNVGWRIDYQIVSPSFTSKIVTANVFKKERFSDHAPLIINYDFSL